MRTLAFNEALREGLHEEMTRDDSVFVIGEDVIAHGGPYKVTDGVAERFPGRIFETPIAEAGIVGVGVGAAMAGMRPVVDLMYLDFVTCAMDEVVNQAAKMRYMSGGQGSVPMVIRLRCGVGRLLAAQHSQIMESWFMHVPGLQVVVPSNPADAKGLFKTAVRTPDPVLFFEYKRIYTMKGEVPDGDYTIPIGLADVKREGEDATIIAVGPMVEKSLQAAVALEDDGWDVEIASSLADCGKNLPPCALARGVALPAPRPLSFSRAPASLRQARSWRVRACAPRPCGHRAPRLAGGRTQSHAPAT